MTFRTRLGSLALAAAMGVSGAVAATTAAPTEAAPAAKPATRWKATLNISKTVIDAEDPVKLSGKVTPAAAGITVKVQKRLEDSNKWVNEKTLKTKAGGAFSYLDNPRTPGKRKYRVIVPATRQHTQGTSPTVNLTIFAWQDLTAVKSRSRSATYADAVEINGTTYDRALSGVTYEPDGFIDWNFAKRCTDLKAKFANGDNSDDVATASVQLVIDGDVAYEKTFGLTESQNKTFDVSTAFRVAFKWTSTNSGDPLDPSGAQAVMASPMVRCSF